MHPGSSPIQHDMSECHIAMMEEVRVEFWLWALMLAAAPWALYLGGEHEMYPCLEHDLVSVQGLRSQL